MTAPAERLRLFIAIVPPLEVARHLHRSLRSLDLPPCRPTPVEQVHMTLLFLGERPARDLETIQAQVARAVGPVRPFELRVQCLRTLPERGAARLVAAITNAPPALLGLHRTLKNDPGRATEPSRDRFLPHLTLARFRSPVRGVSIDVPLEADAFRVDEIVLVRSQLRPEGAVHTPILRAALAART